MFSRKRSIRRRPNLKAEISSVPTVPTRFEPQDDSRADLYSASASPPLPAPDGPSIPVFLPNIPGPYTARGAASSDGYRPTESDIVIAVMGPTGAGKSSFVNTATGREAVTIGHHLTSQTRMVQPVSCIHPDGHRNIVLVDTPGFDDTHLSDVQVLQIIASWLKETYQNNIKLSGILYHHRISDDRLPGSLLRLLSLFIGLCGEDNLKNVVLVTTMWDELEDESVGIKREEELRKDFWNYMTDLGSQICRSQRTYESAWDVIGHLDLERPRRGLSLAPLQIQEEMVDRGLGLRDTTAAKNLLGFLVGEVKRFWGRFRSGTRRLTGTRLPPDGFRRQRFPNRSSISMSTSSEPSPRSSTDTSSLFSRHSGFMLSPAESTSTGCSTHLRRRTLAPAIAGLRLAYQVADFVPAPILRGAIGTALHVAQLVEGMGGTHHAIGQVLDQSGWLLKEIAQYAAHSRLSKDMNKSLKSLKKELENVQKVVINISSRGPVARFFLHDAEVEAITTCTGSLKSVYAKVEVKLAMDNRQALARLEDQLTELCKDMKLRQCQCGTSVIHEEPEEYGECYVEAATGQSSSY